MTSVGDGPTLPISAEEMEDRKEGNEPLETFRGSKHRQTRGLAPGSFLGPVE